MSEIQETADITAPEEGAASPSGGSRTALVVAAAFSLLVSLILIYYAPDLRKPLVVMLKPGQQADSSQILDKAQQKLQRQVQTLKTRFERQTPKANYIIVNTNADSFAVMQGTTLLKKGVCSTGSYIMLVAHDQRKWVFKTPRGMFSIKGKLTNPVWHKPDWAFIEEGLPVPPQHSNSRFERGVLGDYALYLGDGYMLHGTLYQRFLGLPVTHGCIRLGDDDLEYVYTHLDVGSKVFIY